MRNCVYLHEINKHYPIEITNLTLSINKNYYDADFPKFKNLKCFTELKKIRFEISHYPCNEDYLKINFNILNSLKKLELIEISISGIGLNFTKNKLDEKIGSELENVISIKYENDASYHYCIITRKN